MARKAVAKKTVKKKAVAAKPKVVALSGAEIEKQLTLAHKIVAGAGMSINYMLTVRKLSMTRIAESAEKTRAAADHMDRLVALLKG